MRILVGYDGSLSSDAAIDDLRKAGLPDQAEALIMCVADKGLVPPEPADHNEKPMDAGPSKSKPTEAEALAVKAAERIRCHFRHWTVSSEALWGSPAKCILEATAWWHPQLLVAGSHGRSSVARFFLGSVSLTLIHEAACSVRVTRIGKEPRRDGPIRLVIGNDGSPQAESVIRAIAARCWPAKTEAQVISAVQTLVPVTTALEASTYAQEPAYSVIRDADEHTRLRLENVAAESARTLCQAGLIAMPQVVEGDPREAILTAAELMSADTIFVGARGHGRMERLLLGGVSTYIVTHAHCTVEVVRDNQDLAA